MLMILSISLASFTLLYAIFRVIRPLRAITGAMQAVAGSNLDHRIPFQGRRDEIGQFARALRLFRDNVIEKRKLEEALRENQLAKETAEASSKVKSQFLANMSHELRTPLNAIIGFSELLQNQIFGPLQKQYRDYATIIHESGHHLLNLVSDILDIAKIEAGKFVLDIQNVDLTESVAYCVRLVKNRADEQRIKLVTLLPAQGLTFAADQRAFRQILLNLLSNAIKFSRPGDEVEVSRADHARKTGHDGSRSWHRHVREPSGACRPALRAGDQRSRPCPRRHGAGPVAGSRPGRPAWRRAYHRKPRRRRHRRDLRIAAEPAAAKKAADAAA